MSEDMVLIDMNGVEHSLKSRFVIKVLKLGWFSFLLAIVINIAYYIVHPMAPLVSPKEKLKTHILGYLWDIKQFNCQTSETDEPIVNNQPRMKSEYWKRN